MKIFKTQLLLAVFVLTLPLPFSVVEGQNVDYSSNEAILSYGTGFNFGRAMQEQLSTAQTEINIDAVIDGIVDFFKGRQSKFTNDEYQKAAEVVEQALAVQRAKQSEVQMNEGKQAQQEFAATEGVQKTDSGLLYQVIKQGTGAIPSAQDTVIVHYEGSLVDGTVFDSSYARGEPIAFGVTSVIQGWVEALQKMPVGSHWKVMIPSDLGYGERGAPPSIPPGATLIFDIELIDIQ